MTFKPGDVVVWTPQNFNQDWWQQLPEADRLRYYGPLGYGRAKPKRFVFICEINLSDGERGGHCLLWDLDEGRMEQMRHTSEFRKATDEEF